MPLLQSDPQDAFTFWNARTLFADKDGDGYYDHGEPVWTVSDGSRANPCARGE